MAIGSIESRPESQAFIDKNIYSNKNIKYICGGFNGGLTQYYLNMAHELKKIIEIDDNNNIIAKWHDESFINKYYTNNISLFKILSYLYCDAYSSIWYMRPTNKNHIQLRTNNKLIVSFNDNFINDLMRIYYCMNNINDDVSLYTINDKYYLSSRQGILKNFFRIDQTSYKFNSVMVKNIMNLREYNCSDNNIQVYINNYYNLNLDSISVRNFIKQLNLNHNVYTDTISNFITKYGNHEVLHISVSLNKNKTKIYNYIKTNKDKKFIVVNHDKTNNNIITGLNNIEYYKFTNDEEKLLCLSYLHDHVAYNFDDIFMICAIAKYGYNRNIMINYIGLTRMNNAQIDFINKCGLCRQY
jgi:hypothetical protein